MSDARGRGGLRARGGGASGGNRGGRGRGSDSGGRGGSVAGRGRGRGRGRGGSSDDDRGGFRKRERETSERDDESSEEQTATGARKAAPSRNNPSDPRLENLKSAFGQYWAPFIKAIREWETDLKGLDKNAIVAILSDEGFKGAVVASMATALVEYFKPSPMAILTAAEDPSPDVASSWTLSWPKVRGTPFKTANLKELQAHYAPLVTVIKRAMPNCGDSKGPVLLGIPAGMGMGKSHAVDNAGELLFPEEDTLVLKVSYNFSQSLQEERKHAGQGLLARLVLGLHQKVRPDARTVVGSVLTSEMENSLTTEAVVKHVLADPKGKNRNIVVAVDEIGKLRGDAADGNDYVRTVMSQIAEFVKQVYRQTGGKQMAIGLITALPTVDLASLSDRQPQIATPVALTDDESKVLLQPHCDGVRKERIDEIVAMCGGHPRSLAVVASWVVEHHGELPSPAAVSRECQWKLDQACTDRVMVAAIKEAYTEGDVATAPPPENMEKLHRNAMMMVRNGHYALAPTVLFCHNESTILSRLQKMFVLQSQTPTKQLEHTNEHWDYFRCSNDLPVVPTQLQSEVLKSGAAVGTKADRFAFSAQGANNTGTILSQSGGLDAAFRAQGVDDNTYYYPALSNHRAIESMCVAKSLTSDVKTLVLFQSKINDDAKVAVEKLNVAATELAEVWSGPKHEFLYVVFSLTTPTTKIPAVTAKADHPTLVINEERLPQYFTATLAPAALLCLHRHRQSL